MIRLVGAALVAAGGAWMGFQAANGPRRQVGALRQMEAGLALLEQELELSAPPLPRLMALGAERGQGPAQALFRACAQGLERLDREPFSLLWRRLTGERAELGPEGQAILLPLADTLGRCDARHQMEALSAARRRLEALAGQREADCRRQGRVYQALGLSGGVFLVILLL